MKIVSLELEIFKSKISNMLRKRKRNPEYLKLGLHI